MGLRPATISNVVPHGDWTVDVNGGDVGSGSGHFSFDDLACEVD